MSSDLNEEESYHDANGRAKSLSSPSYFFEQATFKLISMSQVAERIQLKDLEAAKRWCDANEVRVHKFGKRHVVYEFDLEYAIGKPLVTALIEKHPDQWKVILHDLIAWDALYNYFLIRFDNQTQEVADETVRTLGDEQTKLLKRLLK